MVDTLLGIEMCCILETRLSAVLDFAVLCCAKACPVGSGRPGPANPRGLGSISARSIMILVRMHAHICDPDCLNTNSE